MEEMTKKLRFILRALPMANGHTHTKLVKRILKEGESYFTNGITSVDEELDFGSIISAALDEATTLNQDMQALLLEQIYTAAGFQHYWEG